MLVLGMIFAVVVACVAEVGAISNTALFLAYPQLGIHAVAINYLVGNALLLHQGEGVDDGEKLADVVGAVDRTIMENLGTGLKVDALVFHRTGIAGTGGIHSPGVGYNFVGQRQNGIVSP